MNIVELIAVVTSSATGLITAIFAISTLASTRKHAIDEFHRRRKKLKDEQQK